ncbi:MAG: sugar transferase [Chloroflexi bacterium]|nr:sugar transferase [Chloroflexota bacterium]MDA1219318.1 sugar transferase [Chloroflexota bacterium]
MRQGQIEYQDIEPPKATSGPDVPPWVYRSRDDDSSRANLTGGGYPLKRLFDLLVVLAGLIISSPMWLIFSVVIKLEDRGPILFTQERWGQNKSKIRVYKFRTMVPNAIEKFGNIQAQENDPRVTRVGRFLRATSLDEMPQLLNILKGDMSWVGPRALPIDEIQAQGDDANLPDDAIPGFEERTRLRPGLTGIAQIFAPRDVPRQQKYQYDAIYANRQSLWLDLRLIFLSLWITLRARWESRESKV